MDRSYIVTTSPMAPCPRCQAGTPTNNLSDRRRKVDSMRTISPTTDRARLNATRYTIRAATAPPVRHGKNLMTVNRNVLLPTKRDRERKDYYLRCGLCDLNGFQRDSLLFKKSRGSQDHMPIQPSTMRRTLYNMKVPRFLSPRFHHLAILALIITLLSAIPALGQSRDIRAHVEYGTGEGELTLKYEFYHDMWSEREVKHGRYCEWQSHDRLAVSGYYFDGLQDSLWQYFYAKGIPKEKSWWNDGLRHGKTSLYDKKGKLTCEREYAHGTLNGLGTDYFPNGKVKAILQYQNAALHGNVTTYNRKGIRKRVLQYKEGKRMKEAKEPKEFKEPNTPKTKPEPEVNAPSDAKAQEKQGLKQEKPRKENQNQPKETQLNPKETTTAPAPSSNPQQPWGQKLEKPKSSTPKEKTSKTPPQKTKQP